MDSKSRRMFKAVRAKEVLDFCLALKNFAVGVGTANQANGEDVETCLLDAIEKFLNDHVYVPE